MAKAISKRWLKIQEQYHRATDEESFKNFLSDQTYYLEMEREKFIVDGCMELIEFEKKYGIQIEKWRDAAGEIGITGDHEQMIKQIRQKRMRFRFEEAKKQADNQKQADNDFFKFIARVGRITTYRIPSDILLIEWVGILTELKESGNVRDNKERAIRED